MAFTEKVARRMAAVAAGPNYAPWLDDAFNAALKAIVDTYKRKTGKAMDPGQLSKFKKHMENWLEEEMAAIWGK